MKIHWLGFGVVLILVAYLAWRGEVGIGLAIMCLPLLAWYASRIIVHGGFGLWHYARHGSKEDWNGRHYEFGGSRLRAEETDDELVFLEKDLLVVIEQPESKTVELFGPAERFLLTSAGEMALTQAGCERLLLKCPHRDAKKLMLFLQREAFHPHLRRHGKLKDRLGEGAPKSATTAPTTTTSTSEERP
jgi:hypothetical protein